MPIYEYRCSNCGQKARKFWRTFSAVDDASLQCPRCAEFRFQRLVSRVAVLRSEESHLEDLADPDSLADSTQGQLDGVRAKAFGVPFFGWKGIKIDGSKMENVIARVSVGQKGSIGNGLYLGGGKKSKPVGWYLGAGYFNNRGPLVGKLSFFF